MQAASKDVRIKQRRKPCLHFPCPVPLRRAGAPESAEGQSEDALSTGQTAGRQNRVSSGSSAADWTAPLRSHSGCVHQSC